MVEWGAAKYRQERDARVDKRSDDQRSNALDHMGYQTALACLFPKLRELHKARQEAGSDKEDVKQALNVMQRTNGNSGFYDAAVIEQSVAATLTSLGVELKQLPREKREEVEKLAKDTAQRLSMGVLGIYLAARKHERSASKPDSIKGMIARLNEDESLALEKLDQRIGAEIGSKERAGEVILSKELTMEYLLGLMEIYNGKFNWKDHIDPLLFRFGPEASPQVAHAILRRETLAGDGAQGAKGGAAGDLTDVIGPDTFWEG